MKQLASATAKQKKGCRRARETAREFALDKNVQDSSKRWATFAEKSTDSASEGLEGSNQQLARSVRRFLRNKTIRRRLQSERFVFTPVILPG